MYQPKGFLLTNKQLYTSNNTKVYLAKNTQDNNYYAIKEIDTSKLSPKEKMLFDNEKKILKNIKHPNPNIIKLHSIIKYEKTPIVHLILEFCNGSTLYNCLQYYIKKKGKPFSEKLVQSLMKKIVNGVKCLHDNGIIHRDINLHNILVNYKYSNGKLNNNLYEAEIKIIDFNKSYYPDSDSTQPQAVIQSFPYDDKIDIWSLGIICYEMLFGVPLFNNMNIQQIIQNILNYNYIIPKTISVYARNFIKSLLKKEGLSFSHLLNNDFLVKDASLFNLASSNTISFNKKNDNNNNKIIPQQNQNQINHSNIINNIQYYNNVHINNFINNNTNNTYKINIIFKREDDSNRTTTITASPDIKYKDLINMYFEKIKRPDLKNNYKNKVNFSLNGLDLEDNNNIQITNNLDNKIIIVRFH